MTDPSSDPRLAAPRAELARLVEHSGLRHIHVYAWRDLDDVEAGGSELFIANVLAEWAGAGLDVTLRTSYAQGHRQLHERDGYRVIRKRGRYMVFPATVITEALRRTGPIDAVMEVWNGVPWLTPLWFRGPKIVMLHHVHREMWRMVLDDGLATAGEAFETRIAPPIYRRSTIVTSAHSSRDDIVEHLGLPARNVVLAPPGIDARFTPGGPKADHPTIVAVGRLMPTKRFDELIRAAAIVRASVPDVQLEILGDGYERIPLQELVDSMGASDWCHVRGRVSDDELLDAYRRAWVVSSASVAEGWGMTLTEAAACGTPAVATRIAGHLDAVAEGSSGLLADTTAELAGQLTSVLTDGELRHRLEVGALHHAAGLTWAGTATAMFEPLARQASGRRRRTR
jgi:glycosyltransferase involved in cell wall biosynthesis